MLKNRSWGLVFLDVGDWFFKMPIPPRTDPHKTDPEIGFFRSRMLRVGRGETPTYREFVRVRSDVRFELV